MDFEARQKAICPQESFIVQAPAGSGKTELLTQRLLALLPTVEEPEQIVALTFTRKAALEMAHRVLHALEDAKNQTPLKSEHQKATRALALRALEHAKHRQWGLLEHPQRLKIKTFDSFCMEIYKAIPKDEFATLSELQTDPAPIYRQAVQNWFNLCRAEEHLHAPLAYLIQQANNQLAPLFKQLISLLAQRDQWLPIIGQNQNKGYEAHIQSLQKIAHHHWDHWSQLLPKTLQNDFIALLQDYHDYAPEGFPELKGLMDLGSIKGTELAAFVKLLLTGNGEVRKAFDQHVGVLQKKPADPRYKTLKENSANFLSALQAYPEFIEKIKQLAKIPHPDEIEIEWETLSAYYQLLPLLVACLHLEFEAQECMDYIYIAQQAIFALEQTDLSLYFDAHLQHLLIDEFQDTSWVQLELIQKLTEPWPHHDTVKTLFLVGDPMQSIYRFRSADVGIFLKVQQQGLGELALEPLYLCQNFRSNTHLIEHFNLYFKNIFPQKEFILEGAVTFHSAQAVIPAQDDCFVHASHYEDETQQTQAIIEILKEAQQYPDINVAILVRTRTKLPQILKALEDESLSFSGIDLFPLSERLHIRDLWNLSKIFLEPGHRVHELSVLRSPLCGLSLEELESLCQHAPTGSIFSSMTLLENPSQRLTFFYTCFRKVWYKKHQQSLVELIQELAEQLSFFQTLTPEQRQEVLTFFQILEHACEKSIWPSLQEIQDKLDHTFVSSAGGPKLQIMTIHKSKGLEFDWVILPDMGRMSQNSNPPALKWLRAEHPNDWQLLPNIKHPSLHLIEGYEDKQEYFELQRLCYVAFTRAKKRLYCLDGQEKGASGSFRRLFPEDYLQKAQASTKSVIEKNHESLMFRVPQYQYIQEPLEKPPAFHAGECFQNKLWQKHFGTITHRILQWICQFHPQSLSDIPWEIARYQFKTLGWSAKETEKGIEKIQELITQFWNDPIGQWLKKPRAFEKNEFALLIQDGDIVRNAIIDRTFVEDNTLWIIDFKTHTEKQQYQQQLNRYAQALNVLYPQYRLSCGLFYLTTATWKTWIPTLLEELTPA